MSEYIRREEAVKALRTHISITISSEHDLTPYEKEINELGRGIYDAQKAAIDSIPPADVRENIHGEWIKNFLGIAICSKCGEPMRDKRVNHINFCNCCGADMRGK